MNPNQFAEWLEFHRSNSKLFREFLKSITRRSERDELRAEWFREMGPLSLQQAKNGTNRMINSGEIEEVEGGCQVFRAAELGRQVQMAATSAAREEKRQQKLEEGKRARQDLDDRFGEVLDGMSQEALEEFAERVFAGNKFLQDFFRRKVRQGEDPRRSSLVRSELLKQMRRDEIKNPNNGRSQAENFNDMRQDVFAGLDRKSVV